MAAAAAAIFNRQLTAGQGLSGHAATPMDSSTPGTNGSSGDSATISANDFLTLLVTEMQNQDPTADTDPNEYINQLVQVNSLEQLIGINQTLTADSTPAAGAKPALAGTNAANTAAGAASGTHGTSAGTSALVAVQSAVAGGTAETQSGALKRVSGNMSVPASNPAAERVAHALDGRTHTQPGMGGLSRAQ